MVARFQIGPAWSVALGVLFLAGSTIAGERRAIPVELYTGAGEASAQVREWLEDYAAEHEGLLVYVHDTSRSESAQRRFEAVRKYFRFGENDLPVVYAMGQAHVVRGGKAELTSRLDEMRTITVFVRRGCPHCRDARAFFAKILPDYPAVKIDYRELIGNPIAQRDFNALVRKYRQRAASTPGIHFCNKLFIGFDHESTTGAQLKKLLDRWTVPDPVDDNDGQARASPRANRWYPLRLHSPPWPLAVAFSARPGLPPLFAVAQTVIGTTAHVGSATSRQLLLLAFQESPEDEPPLLPLPGEPSDEADESGTLPLPGSNEAAFPAEESAPAETEEAQAIRLKGFGRVSVDSLGMPLFTIAVGLVDGFNPCAMWVLLFLLSVLVNLKDRLRIFAVAGSFVFVSGAVYFAFMAAWLNVLKLIDYLDETRIIFGILAIIIGAIHIKDFFAFKRGISLSIPESAKPGIYARVRRIVNAENLPAAIAGAIVLAVLVNFFELLCTAGLPAMYTNILALQGYPPWKDYAYLALYNVAYMFDDAMVLIIVLVTLGRHKLQETQGRWLKLFGGIVIFALGVVMLFRPDWLGAN